MTFVDNQQSYGLHQFFNKFKILDKIPWTEDLIDGSIRAVCDELAVDNIDYCWLDFSINKYMCLGWHKSEAIKFIYDCFQRYRPGKVGLVLSLKYESSRETQRQYATIIEDGEIAELLFGIDLVGDEAFFDINFYRPILMQWKQAGKMVRGHVGESGPVENIRSLLHSEIVTNIAHGLKIIGDVYSLEMAKDLGIYFDLGLSSNYYCGLMPIVNQVNCHPLTKMHDQGILLTIGTDDPVICNTTLVQEFSLAYFLGISQDDLTQIAENAIISTMRFLNLFTEII